MDTGHWVKAVRGMIQTATYMSDPQGEQGQGIGPSVRRNPANLDDRRSKDCTRRDGSEGQIITRDCLHAVSRRVFICFL
jgi:hypothetical protein